MSNEPGALESQKLEDSKKGLEEMGCLTWWFHREFGGKIVNRGSAQSRAGYFSHVGKSGSWPGEITGLAPAGKPRVLTVLCFHHTAEVNFLRLRTDGKRRGLTLATPGKFGCSIWDVRTLIPTTLQVDSAS